MMRVVLGVGAARETLPAVNQIGLLYQLDEVVLAHGAKMEPMQEYGRFRDLAMESGRRHIEECRALLSTEIPSIRTLCDAQDPSSFILDTGATVNADLIVMGTRDLARLTEVFIGSVSHRVLTHSTVPTLIVKGAARPVSKVLLAVEGSEDAARLQAWLTAHPFKNPVSLTVLSVVSSPPVTSEHGMVEQDVAHEERTLKARQSVDETVKALNGPRFTASADVRGGDPIELICEVGKGYDLIVVGSHGRTGVRRFLMGSVSEEIVHRADRSVLVVR
ncbi:MAG: universal stress protein [Nitrospira sp.]|nr:universal stress protein [Nitrospira sp.]MBX3347626.1 universal stress protein [Nitrospira sp.]